MSSSMHSVVLGANVIAFAQTCQHGMSPLSLYIVSFPIINCLALHLPAQTVIVLDTSPMCLALVCHNAVLHGLAG